MLPPGTRVPDFEATAVHKEDAPTALGERVFSLRKALGGRSLVLGFFPFAFSPGCVVGMCEFRDSMRVFEDEGMDLYAFTSENKFVAHSFARTCDIPYPILCDPNREALRRLGALREYYGIKDVAAHGVLVIDPQGVVVHSWERPEMPPKGVVLGTLEFAFKDYKPKSQLLARLLKSVGPNSVGRLGAGLSRVWNPFSRRD